MIRSNLPVSYAMCIIHSNFYGNRQWPEEKNTKTDDSTLCLFLSQLMWSCIANSLLIAKKRQQLRRLLSCGAFHSAITTRMTVEWDVWCRQTSNAWWWGRWMMQSGCESRHSAWFRVGCIMCRHHCCRFLSVSRCEWLRNPIWAMEPFTLRRMCTNLI